MANCKNCVFYSQSGDELQRAHDDVLKVGREENDRHFCFAYVPIPDGVYESGKECPTYTPNEAP